MTVSDWINLAIAIGTVGSCIVAVWLAYDSKRKKLDCVFVWREEENYNPVLSINNICDRTIIIENITFIYRNTIVGNMDFVVNANYSSQSVVVAHSKNEIKIREDLFYKIKLDENNEEKHYLFIIVKSTTGNIFVSSYRYSDSDICELIFMHAMCSD